MVRGQDLVAEVDAIQRNGTDLVVTDGEPGGSAADQVAIDVLVRDIIREIVDGERAIVQGAGIAKAVGRRKERACRGGSLRGLYEAEPTLPQ